VVLLFIDELILFHFKKSNWIKIEGVLLEGGMRDDFNWYFVFMLSARLAAMLEK